MKPVIIITGPNTEATDVVSYGLPQKQLFQNYADPITLAGGLPLLALDVDETTSLQLAEQADGLYITGGKDVNPKCYGMEKLPFCGVVDDMRDEMESLLFRAFIKVRKPIFGICRGIQMINVMLGGTLYQDIRNQLGIPHNYNSIHSVTTVPGTPIEELFGKEFIVNSLHHQAICRLGDGLIPMAFSEGRAIIEAVRHESLPILATQWHPERMTGAPRWSPEGPDMLPLFRYFISLC